MAGEVAAAMASIQMVQGMLYMLQSTLGYGGYLCPLDADINKLTTMGSIDFIVVGAGSAGSVLARRLSECTDSTVLVIESGGCPGLESLNPGYFPLQPQTYQDYNMTSVNDGYSGQNLQGNSCGLTAGKMYGGSSGIQHLFHVVGNPLDFNEIAKIAGNSTFSYKNILRYLKKSENLQDPAIYRQYAQYHGTKGPIKLTRQVSPLDKTILDAFAELGYKVVNDTNTNVTNNVITEPLYEIGDFMRQSGLVSYISDIKMKPNVYFLSGATVTKIMLEKNVAVGVKVTYKGKSYIFKANKEVIVAAGALKTPQLMMLSGIGNPEHLKSKNIPVKVNNTYVGQNLIDHITTCMIYKLGESDSPPPAINPRQFPVPVTCAYGSLNKSQPNADYQAINLFIPRKAEGLLQLCLNVFKYKVNICQKWYEANENNNVLLVAAINLVPIFKGNVTINTTNINDQPVIYLNLLNEKKDLVNTGKFLKKVNEIEGTESFRKVGGEFNTLGLCSEYKFGSDKFWQCYTLAMASTTWHYCGTCSLGSCLDSSFKVVGTERLRVVDASSLPRIPGGKINAAVVALAELASCIIKSENGLCCS